VKFAEFRFSSLQFSHFIDGKLGLQAGSQKYGQKKKKNLPNHGKINQNPPRIQTNTTKHNRPVKIKSPIPKSSFQVQKV